MSFSPFLTESVLNVVNLMAQRTNLKGLMADVRLKLLSSPICNRGLRKALQCAGKHSVSSSSGVFIGCILPALM